MATIKISELEELNKSNGEDLLVIVDSVENATKKIKAKNLGVGGSSVPAGDTLPIGSIVPYGSKEVPTNWLACNGQAVSRTTYADLFTIIGTQFGEGDGSTTFNLPDLNQYRVPIGYDRLEEQSERMNLGTVGGEEKHTMTAEELLKHAHNTYTGSDGTGEYAIQFRDIASGSKQLSYIVTEEVGGNKPFNVMQPYVTTNYIIKAFQSSGVVANVAQVETNSDIDTYSCNYVNNLNNNIISKINGTVLYSSPTGTTEDITLSNSVSNYDYIEVYAQKSNCHTSVKIDSIGYVLFCITITNAFGNTDTQQINATYKLENNKLTKIFEDASLNNGGIIQTNEVNVYKIIGYKYN